MYKLQLKISGGTEGSNQRNLICGYYGYFLESHNDQYKYNLDTPNAVH